MKVHKFELLIYGFESRSGQSFFRLKFHNCLSCVHNCNGQSYLHKVVMFCATLFVLCKGTVRQTDRQTDSQSVSQSSVSQSVSQSVRYSVSSYSVTSRSVSQSINQSMSQSVSRSVIISVNSVIRSVSQSVTVSESLYTIITRHRGIIHLYLLGNNVK